MNQLKDANRTEAIIQPMTRVEVGLAWILEEMSEAINDSRRADIVADALFDTLGIIIEMLVILGPDQIRASHNEYVDSQIRRGRTVDGITHHELISLMTDALFEKVSDIDRVMYAKELFEQAYRKRIDEKRDTFFLNPRALKVHSNRDKT